MGQIHDKRFPGESDAYRAARNQLLEAEIGLRRQAEEIAALRRRLPIGGAVPKNYAFQEVVWGQGNVGVPREVTLSELFGEGKRTLVLYSLMYGVDAEAACPMCTAFLDGLNGNAPYIEQRISLAIVAKAPVETLGTLAEARGWRNLRVLSSKDNNYNSDYFAESADGSQQPSCNVFVSTQAGIHHSYNTELFFAPAEPGQHPRHVDALWPLWNMFDLTPDGRGDNWFPAVA
ncbi:MAG: DUF899 family protein [Pseudomonadota bacterium]